MTQCRAVQRKHKGNEKISQWKYGNQCNERLIHKWINNAHVLYTVYKQIWKNTGYICHETRVNSCICPSSLYFSLKLQLEDTACNHSIKVKALISLTCSKAYTGWGFQHTLSKNKQRNKIEQIKICETVKKKWNNAKETGGVLESWVSVESFNSTKGKAAKKIGVQKSVCGVNPLFMGHFR